ncbi:MAG: TlpA disulfide reductase family protein [Acidobacteriota bacterium]
MKLKHIVIFFWIFIFLSAGTFSDLKAEVNDSDPGKLAYKIMKMADSHKRKGEIKEAGKIYMEAASIYKKAVKSDPGNRIYKNNFKYCLGTRGFIQIKHAQKLFKEKNFKEAAIYYKGAETSYKYALLELPDERNFKTNMKYAQFHGGTANFEHILNSKGKIPPFKLEGFTGRKITSEILKDNVILLEFWAGWCPSCKKSMTMLQKLHKKYFLKGLTVLAVAMDRVKTWKKYGSEKKAVETSKNHNFSFAWGTEKTYIDYGNFNSIPTVLLIDKKGNFYKKISSEERTEENLSKIIETLLKK